MVKQENAAIPSVIDVGPFPYRIITDQAACDRDLLEAGFDNQTCGTETMLSLKIHIRPDLPLPIQRETLLHEIRHAVDGTSGIHSTQKMTAEEYITRTTPLLLDTLRRNPALVAFLLEA